MMEMDNRVFVRVRGRWHVEDPGYALQEAPANGWPHIKSRLLNSSDLILWRGKVLKDQWGRYKRAEFLAELTEQEIPFQL